MIILLGGKGRCAFDRGQVTEDRRREWLLRSRRKTEDGFPVIARMRSIRGNPLECRAIYRPRKPAQSFSEGKQSL